MIPIRSLALLVATSAVWVAVTAATAPGPELTATVQGTPHASAEAALDCSARATVDNDDQHFACQRQAIHHTASQDFGCWVEKVHSVDSAEVICGDPGDRPRADTADIGEVFAVHTYPTATDGTFVGDCGWMASWAQGQGFDIAPAGCN